eukprot:TRINITY_DN16335_c0_g1_i1.p1 TRINITY_DN16335_c0_g1~~TRINITY_DN16335_c0_g1_i1.p1  ORF type:complete len:503 (+),score=88.36 TRINITY_DN16335_c0_g1_i1:45-1553(+)
MEASGRRRPFAATAALEKCNEHAQTLRGILLAPPTDTRPAAAVPGPSRVVVDESPARRAQLIAQVGQLKKDNLRLAMRLGKQRERQRHELQALEDEVAVLEDGMRYVQEQNDRLFLEASALTAAPPPPSPLPEHTPAHSAAGPAGTALLEMMQGLLSKHTALQHEVERLKGKAGDAPPPASPPPAEAATGEGGTVNRAGIPWSKGGEALLRLHLLERALPRRDGAAHSGAPGSPALEGAGSSPREIALAAPVPQTSPAQKVALYRRSLSPTAGRTPLVSTAGSAPASVRSGSPLLDASLLNPSPTRILQRLRQPVDAAAAAAAGCGSPEGRGTAKANGKAPSKKGRTARPAMPANLALDEKVAGHKAYLQRHLHEMERGLSPPRSSPPPARRSISSPSSSSSSSSSLSSPIAAIAPPSSTASSTLTGPPSTATATSPPLPISYPWHARSPRGGAGTSGWTAPAPRPEEVAVPQTRGISPPRGAGAGGRFKATLSPPVLHPQR